jgi:uncharacterized SAM-binding protein YcdF (DUF218 family)
MFIFLSKLLPLFIYPLGITCLFMGISLVLSIKNGKLSIIPLVLALLILLIASNNWVAFSLVRSLEWQNIATVTDLPEASAIVVLGGGVKPSIPPRPWIELGEAGDRIIYGVKLYKQGKAPLLILSGGRVDWQGKQSPESTDMASIAELMGVPSSAILQDKTSLNTRQNAVNVKKILDEQKITGKILLVTSAMHIPRSLLIFQKLGIDVIPAPTDFFITNKDFYQSSSFALKILNLIPDVDNLEKTTKALKEYLGIFVYRLKGWL